METLAPKRVAGLSSLIALLALSVPAPAGAGCGCDKPPPPRAAVRPFVGHVEQRITLFDDRLAPNQSYDVEFVSRGGTADWSRGKSAQRKDLADRAMRTQLRVSVPEVPLGPCAIRVWRNGQLVYALSDDQFTVAAEPIPLDDIDETVTREGYRAGVGADGTVYIPVDVGQVNDATTFTGVAVDFPLVYSSGGVVMYNDQGFLMQLLDPTVPGLFNISSGNLEVSNALAYWRHEFKTYKRQHRLLDTRRTDTDPEWHADGSPHIDHDHIVVAISGTMPDGSHPAPGATPPFTLLVMSSANAASATSGSGNSGSSNSGSGNSGSGS
jgi:hypothetical protein